MSPRNSGYMNDVDELIAKTPLDVVLAYYRAEVPTKSSGEHRMNCVFNESCHESQYSHLTVKIDDPINRIYCHSCGVRGNLLTLIHGLEHHQAPAEGRLRGAEFKRAVEKLREIVGQNTSEVLAPTEPTKSTISKESIDDSPLPELINVPLREHPKEAARALENLYEELIVDVEKMSPAAAKYVRQRPWMTPDLMKKWGVGWIPGNGRSLFRKNYLVYTHRNEAGDVVSYSGRDLQFESKWDTWQKKGSITDKKPNKHRYVSGYHRGLELYGGFEKRLKTNEAEASLRQRGLIIVEGMNDVLRLETLGAFAVGLGSNKATENQIAKMIELSNIYSDNRVVLMPDCDDEGESGFQELLWKLSEQHVNVKLGWSRNMQGFQRFCTEPEDLTIQEWNEIDKRISK